MNEKINSADLRVQKTRKALFDTLLSLLNRKRFDAITVNELCDQALVRRATFYQHFADKYDFFSAFVHHISESFYHQLPLDFTTDTPQKTYAQLFSQFLSFLEENEKLIYNCMDSNAFPLLLDIIAEEINQRTLQIIRDSRSQTPATNPPAEILASFLTGGLVQIAKDWIHTPDWAKDDVIRDVHVLLDSIPFAPE